MLVLMGHTRVPDMQALKDTKYLFLVTGLPAELS